MKGRNPFSILPKNINLLYRTYCIFTLFIFNDVDKITQLSEKKDNIT